MRRPQVGIFRPLSLVLKEHLDSSSVECGTLFDQCRICCSAYLEHVCRFGITLWQAVCYSAESKKSLLGLEPTRLTATKAHAVELALAIREKLDSDWGLGESGVDLATYRSSLSLSPTVFMMSSLYFLGRSRWTQKQLSRHSTWCLCHRGRWTWWHRESGA